MDTGMVKPLQHIHEFFAKSTNSEISLLNGKAGLASGRVRVLFTAGCLLLAVVTRPEAIFSQSSIIQWSAFSSGFGYAQGNGTNITALAGHPGARSQSDTGILTSGFLSNKAARVIASDREASMDMPVRFELFQNYPNPFNPSTTIPFAVATTGPVTLRIFDILGREAVLLLNRDMPAGYHSLDWNAAGYPTGVYLYTLETVNTRLVMKMILLK
jgi:hypothetical protein